MKTNRGLVKNTSNKLKFRFLFNLNMFLNLITKQKETTFLNLQSEMEICWKHHACLLKAPQNNIKQRINALKNETLLSQPSFKVARSCEN